MPASCCITKCRNQKKNGVSLFRFPFKRKELLQQWLESIGDVNFKPKKFDVICSAHFQQSNFLSTRGESGILLKHGAVPSVFPSMLKNKDPLPDPSTMQIMTENMISKKSLKKKEVYRTSTRSLLKINQHSPVSIADVSVENVSTMSESIINVSDTIKHPKVKKVKTIMHSSTLHFKNQEMSPRRKKMQREIKTLKEKLKRKNNKILSLQELCKELRSILHLPHTSSVRNWLSLINIVPGFLNV